MFNYNRNTQRASCHHRTAMWWHLMIGNSSCQVKDFPWLESGFKCCIFGWPGSACEQHRAAGWFQPQPGSAQLCVCAFFACWAWSLAPTAAAVPGSSACITCGTSGAPALLPTAHPALRSGNSFSLNYLNTLARQRTQPLLRFRDEPERIFRFQPTFVALSRDNSLPQVSVSCFLHLFLLPCLTPVQHMLEDNTPPVWVTFFPHCTRDGISQLILSPVQPLSCPSSPCSHKNGGVCYKYPQNPISEEKENWNKYFCLHEGSWIPWQSLPLLLHALFVPVLIINPVPPAAGWISNHPMQQRKVNWN